MEMTLNKWFYPQRKITPPPRSRICNNTEAKKKSDSQVLVAIHWIKSVIITFTYRWWFRPRSQGASFLPSLVYQCKVIFDSLDLRAIFGVGVRAPYDDGETSSCLFLKPKTKKTLTKICDEFTLMLSVISVFSRNSASIHSYSSNHAAFLFVSQSSLVSTTRVLLMIVFWQFIRDTWWIAFYNTPLRFWPPSRYNDFDSDCIASSNEYSLIPL